MGASLERRACPQGLSQEQGRVRSRTKAGPWVLFPGTGFLDRPLCVGLRLHCSSGTVRSGACLQHRFDRSNGVLYVFSVDASVGDRPQPPTADSAHLDAVRGQACQQLDW